MDITLLSGMVRRILTTSMLTVRMIGTAEILFTVITGPGYRYVMRMHQDAPNWKPIRLKINHRQRRFPVRVPA